MENFDDIINENNISQETNLISINPIIIRLNPDDIAFTSVPWIGHQMMNQSTNKDHSVAGSTVGGLTTNSSVYDFSSTTKKPCSMRTYFSEAD